jgi:diaminohydroxyphosphoribosylaminopyrimidine deaminase / 5-amino-6-(5-phosphoribosylamino)uracil reductase
MNDELFMQRALELARLGLGNTSPNPLVGCVMVREGRIIGEGWHREYGAPHAEVNAIESILDQAQLRGATAYVSLEPCAHFGKTPPCAEKLIEVGVKRVVIATLDTNPLVGGKGIKKLRDAGIDVTVGVLEKESRQVNHRFFTSVEQQTPYIILKWAETADGFIASENREQKWISNIYSRQRVHQWRSQEDAVLVGTHTARVDNPRLNVRDWSGRNPLRVIIDRSLQLPQDLHIFDRSQPTLLYNCVCEEVGSNMTYVKLSKEDFLNHLLSDLQVRQIQSVMVEGGAQTLSTFIGGGRWHEARIFRSMKSFGKGILAPVLRGQVVQEEKIMDDQLSVLRNPLLVKS